jgi:hypothetical protein
MGFGGLIMGFGDLRFGSSIQFRRIQLIMILVRLPIVVDYNRILFGYHRDFLFEG